MKLFVAVVMFTMISVAFADDVVWEIASSDLPGGSVPYLTQEGGNPTKPGVNDQPPYANRDSQELQQNSWNLLPSVDLQPSTNARDKQPSTNNEDIEVQREANAIERKANHIARKANKIQRDIRSLTGCLVAVGIIVGSLQILLVYLQSRLITSRERPWIVVNPIEVYRNEHTPHASYGFKWVAENVGSSPAFLTGLTRDVKIVPYPIPDELPEYPEKKPFAQFIISARRKHKSEERGSIAPSDFAEFREGKKALAFYGFVEYRGAFSGPHRTRFYTYWVYEEGSLMYYPVGPPNTVEYT